MTSEKIRTAADRLKKIQALGLTNPFDVVVDDLLSPTEGIIRGRKTLLFGTHNYLGLSMSKQNIEGAISAVRKYGTGTTGSRIANGTFCLHAELEEKIEAFMRRRNAIVFSTGYQANLGSIAGLVGRGDQLFIDADSHASIYDGAKLSGAEVIRFRHNSPRDLAKRIERVSPTIGMRLIVIESVYSMTGNITPLRDFVNVKKQTGLSLLVDEAHSFGLMGSNGRGLAEMEGLEGDIDFITGTFSKSVGTVGGFCVSNHSDIEFLRYCSRPYMFTASLPPDVIGATIAGLQQISERPDLREKLMENARSLRCGLSRAGFRVGISDSPIISVDCGDEATGIRMWEALLEHGLYVNLSLPPATPNHNALLRCSVMAPHTDRQIECAITVFRKVGAEVGII
ncbi:serine palmitoyltransferase [Acetobacter pasteurianus]|uniref:serine palmitoyltransferase n=1 Tax=Acetobacter pasteurianus TaxID=438 RepID=UPI0035A23FB3